jgi:putative transcriptional regulator
VDSDPLKGRLLVATPVLGDANFDLTVVLLLEHNEEGALGVVLNRPSMTEVGGPLPEWGDLAAHPPVFFVGGPVAPTAVIGLARVSPQAEAEGWNPVLGPVGVIDLSRSPIDIGMPIQKVRVFAGYAGWEGGQLEGEIEAGAWFVVDADLDDALSPEPDGLWRAVLRRQRGDLALFSQFPPNPSMN